MTTQAQLTVFAGQAQAAPADLDSNLVAAGSGSLMYGGQTTHVTNAYSITVPNRITAYIDGYVFSFIANFTSTGPATLTVTPQGGTALNALNLKTAEGVALGAGDITSGTMYQFRVVTVSGNTHLRKIG